MKRAARRRNIAIALGTLAILTGVGIWVLDREATLIYAVNALSGRLDGRLQAADVRGSLLRKIEVRDLRYHDEFGAIEIESARLEWRPVRLLMGQVAVGEMAAEKVKLQLAPSEDEERKPPESLAAPISFAVTDFNIDTLSVVRPEGTHEIRNLRAAFSGGKDRLRAEVKSLATQYGNVTGELKLGAHAPFALDGHVELTSPDPRVYSMKAKLGGSLMHAEASIDAQARDSTAAATLAVAPYEAQPLTRLELTAKNFDPHAWAASAPVAKLNADARLATDEARKLTGTVALTNSAPGTIDEKKLPFKHLSTMLEGTLEDMLLRDVKLDLASAGAFAGGGAWRDGSLAVNLETRGFNIEGLKKDLRPTALAGKLALSGNAEAQRVRFDLAQQAYRFRFSGAFAEGVARIEEAYAHAGGGELAARGRIALAAQKAFSVDGRLRNFDPSRFGAYPSHQVNGRFTVKGHVGPVLQVAADVNLTDSRLGGLPATVKGTFRSQRTDTADVSMDVAMQVGGTRATAKGVVRDPADKRSIDMALTLAGGSLGELYKIIGIPLPATPAYRIEGRLVQSGEQWEFRKFAGRVGDSDLSGDFLVDRGRAPQFIKADLKSNRLALVDLAGFVGAEKTAEGKVATPEDASRVLPQKPYSLEKLKSADADVKFEGRRVITEQLPVNDMTAHLVLKGGVLTLAPLNFGVAGGNLVSNITLDGRKPVIVSSADIRVRSLQLDQLLPKMNVQQASVGEVDGRVNLTARGNSIAAMLGSANGETSLVVGEGEVSDLILRLSNLDVANTLLVLMRGDKKIPLRCMVADLTFENGIMQPRQFVIDTTHTALVGEGKANFADETLDLRLVAKPRGPSLLSLRGPIVVGGSFADPSVRPDLKRLAARGTAAAALAVVATPLAAVLPFVQAGGAPDIQCGPLLQAAKQKIHQPAIHHAQR